ncbi:hypothetical protein BDA96_01G138900 [Sorghum bicolor]|uniref:Bifunctional inhibitor/plant lipid transfer protein/seed storage helical domain-containing protein n=2 Tax=Sorghum bicolor TaxID=4558 RepID=A0A921RXW5_SORBI|nr:uncharacterized protein LOC110436402 isoform X2 [Sorghum bicolor]KAG0548116.1 hypothetical protein BDA96_01G138900 [Sorghum bicolor]KXG37824.1 hypothetical protein SORBI_3001G133300 [Sorghum bicolor]|eukprot:XP_021319162.1 uncharacterized protein LOC110436402 isoform X2 [Sorghum bicolor]
MKELSRGCFAALLLWLLLAGGEGCDLPRRLAAPCAAGVASSLEEDGVKVGGAKAAAGVKMMPSPLEEDGVKHGGVKVGGAKAAAGVKMMPSPLEEDGGVKVGGAKAAAGVKMMPVKEGRRKLSSGCDAQRLGFEISVNCRTSDEDETVNPKCCEPVAAAVDLDGCLCLVMNTTYLGVSSFLPINVYDIYSRCGGLRSVSGQTECEASSGGNKAGDDSPSSTTIREAVKEALRARVGSPDFVVDVVELVLGLITVFCVLGRPAARYFSKYRARKMAAQQQAMQDVVQKSMTTVIEMMGGQIQACVQEAIQGVANSSVSGQTESTAPPDSSGRGEIRTATDV